MSLLSQIWNHVHDSLGHPQTLEKWLATVPASDRRASLALTAGSIAASDIVRWDRLGQPAGNRPGAATSLRGVVQGWQEGPSGYRHVELHVPALAHLTRLEERPSWHGDLRDIQGLSSSKSSLGDHASMAQFAQGTCVSLIEPTTSDHLDRLLAWDEIRLSPTRRQDPMACFAWDGRLMLLNEGGSHHLAAAQHVARQLDRPVPLSTRLQLHTFNTRAVDELRHEFDMFLVPAALLGRPEFFDGMRAVGATHYTLPLPAPHHQARALLLPRAEPHSVAVANLLREAGFTDFGAMLTTLAHGLARHPDADRPANQALLAQPSPLASMLKTEAPVSTIAHAPNRGLRR